MIIDYKTVTNMTLEIIMRKIYGFKRICAVCAAFLLTLNVFGMSSGGASMVGSADETKDKYESQLEELRKQQTQIDSEIAEAQKKIDSENGNLEAINAKYKSLKKKIENAEAQSLELEDQMVELDTQLREAQYQLEDQNKAIEKTKNDFMERIRAMYVAGGANSYENVLINSSDFYDVLMRVELLKRVAEHDSETLDSLLEQKRAIEETEKQITDKTDRLRQKAQDYSEMQSELAGQQTELLKMKEESGSELIRLENDRDGLLEQSRQLDMDYAEISSLAETTTTTSAEDPKDTEKTTAKTSSGDGKTTKKTTTSKPDGNTGTEQTTSKKQTTTKKQTTAPQTEKPVQTTTTTTQQKPADPPSDSSRQEKINTVIAYAKSNVGGAYIWGGSSFRACDCSGLIMISFGQIGISLPHFAASQANYGTTVAYSDLQPGDVVFFGGSSYSSIYHVALYIGDGRIVHAENSTTGIVISNLASFSRYNGITTIKRLL